MADEGAGSQIAPHGIRRWDFAAPHLKVCTCTSYAQRPVLGLIDVEVGNRQTDSGGAPYVQQQVGASRRWADVAVLASNLGVSVAVVASREAVRGRGENE